VLGAVCAAADELVRAAAAILAGGLLISLPADKALSLEAEFRARGVFLARIGGVCEGTGVAVG
jgi:hypothetical protein